MTASPDRWAWAEIDLEALAHNIGVVRRAATPSELWAVVKADGYGHGAVTVARAALDAGATGLCVALVSEGSELRRAGVECPILLFGEPPPHEIGALVEASITPTVFSERFVDALAEVGRRAGVVVPCHVNVDTGMQRVGVSPSGAGALVDAVLRHTDALHLDGIYTHLACADEPDHPANAEQLARFDLVVDELRGRGIDPRRVHVANSAGALALAPARRSLVRAGIAIYGISPGPGVDRLAGDLRPVMRLAARVSHVKPVVAGSHVSYGWRHRFARDTVVATVPIGYADGVPRRLGTLPDAPGFEVLVGGRRHPIVGVVTMDQFMVDVGDAEVHVGDEVVLIGAQGDERIRVEDWATRLGTIGYEIVCGIGARVPRKVVGADRVDDA